MPLRVGNSMPNLDGPIMWMNTYNGLPPRIQSKPALVYFWAASCPACIRNMPAVEAWKERYAPHDLRLVAVHLPRIPSDHDKQTVRQAVAQHHITDPCANDSEGVLAERFQTGDVWPYYFFFDADKKLRSRAAGGRGLRLLENTLNRYLTTR